MRNEIDKIDEKEMNGRRIRLIEDKSSSGRRSYR